MIQHKILNGWIWKYYSSKFKDKGIWLPFKPIDGKSKLFIKSELIESNEILNTT